MTLEELARKLSCVRGIDNASVNKKGSIDVTYHNVMTMSNMWSSTILSNGTIEWDNAVKADFPAIALRVIKEYKLHNTNSKENTNMSDNDINAKIKKDVKQLAKDLNDKKRYDQNTSTAKRILHNLESEYGLSFKSKKSKSKSRKDN